MEKFDTSCGLTRVQIHVINHVVKNDIGRHLPVLLEPVEMKLFFEGRDAWEDMYFLSMKKYQKINNERAEEIYKWH